MDKKDMLKLCLLLDEAVAKAEQRRSTAFDNDQPYVCRKWLMRRDHLREARSVVVHMISEV